MGRELVQIKLAVGATVVAVGKFVVKPSCAGSSLLSVNPDKFFGSKVLASFWVLRTALIVGTINTDWLETPLLYQNPLRPIPSDSTLLLDFLEIKNLLNLLGSQSPQDT